jgi:hypothetical protein
MRAVQGIAQSIRSLVVEILAIDVVMWPARDRAMSDIEEGALKKVRDNYKRTESYRVLSLKLRLISKLTAQILSASAPLENVLRRARQVLLNKRANNMKRDRAGTPHSSSGSDDDEEEEKKSDGDEDDTRR